MVLQLFKCLVASSPNLEKRIIERLSEVKAMIIAAITERPVG